jgi:hypothetical protein
MVQKSHGKGKSKGKKIKPQLTTTFKKKKFKKGQGCFVRGSTDHWTKKCSHRKGRKLLPKQKTVNTVTMIGVETSGYNSLPSIFLVFQSTSWWLDTGANVHVCSNAILFSSYQTARDSTVMMGNGSHATVRGVGTIDLKLTSGKIVQLKNMQHVPTIGKNLVSGTLLFRDGFKVVIESNKFVVSKCGQFIGKGYECGGLFHFSVSDYYHKSVNLISDRINESNASVWHSRLCYLNFSSIF